MDFKIRVPIWREPRSVGIANHKIESWNTIEILYRDRDKKRLYPFVYVIRGEEARKYPVQTVQGIDLRIIPINDLKVWYPKK